MLDPLILSALLSLAAPTALKDWKPCSADSALLCATLQVPLDYKSQKTIGVALIKYPAPKQPAKGSVLYVAGGPGSSGIQRVQSGGKELCERYLDNSMDLIGFDARGVGQTIPLKCFNSTEQYLALLNPKHGFSASMTSEEYALALAEEELTAQDCAAYSGGEYLNYTSTYYTARDMDEIRKFVGSEMMNSMGFSYGTLLSATYANMFPEKVGRMILDGVVNPIHYFNPIDFVKSLYKDRLISLKAFGTFCDQAKCPLYSEEETTYDRITRILGQVKRQPLIFRKADMTGLITHDMLSEKIQSALYGPARWTDLAKDLKAIDEGNMKGLEAYVDAIPKLSEVAKEMETVSFGLKAIYYADMDSSKVLGEADIRNMLTEANNLLEPLSAKVFVKGQLLGNSANTWKTKDNLRYTGPWNNKFANPILLANTKYDPATPLSLAEETLKLMNQGGKNNAVLLQQDSVGHLTSKLQSACTINAFRAYMLQGKLPATGTICKPDVPNPFQVKKP